MPVEPVGGGSDAFPAWGVSGRRALLPILLGMPAKSMSKDSGELAFQLRITLEGVVPPVWRRLLVPGVVRLSKLHAMIQVAMGWNDSHLHSFEIGNVRYGMHADDYPEDEIDETGNVGQPSGPTGCSPTSTTSVIHGTTTSWSRRLLRSASTLKFGVCLDGQNACPPNDSGGVWGYAQMLEVLADPTHAEHDDLMAWSGPIDPTEFDLVGVNAALQRLR